MAVSTNSDSDRIYYLSHCIEREALEPGDHIYVYRAYGLYQHHGIYIGKPNREVIHVSGTESKSKSTALVRISTLDEFLGGYALRLVAYGESAMATKGKRHGTSHTMASRPASQVIEAAEYYASNPDEWGKYNVASKNCETFAMHCKTGDESLVSDQVVGWYTFFASIFTTKQKKAEE